MKLQILAVMQETECKWLAGARSVKDTTSEFLPSEYV